MSRRRTSLGRRLFAALGAMLLPLIAVAVAGVVAFRTSIGDLEEFRDETVAESKQIDGMKSLLLEFEDAAEEHYFDSSDEDAAAEYMAVRALVERGFDDLAGTMPEERRLSSAAYDSWQESIAVADKLASYPGGELPEELVGEGFHDPIDRATDLLSELYVVNSQEISGQISTLHSDERTQLIVTLAILVAGSAAAVLLAARLRRSISAPLFALKEAAIQFGSDNLSHRVALESDDELGAVAKAFNRMAAIVGEQRDALTETAERQQRAMKRLERSESQKEESLSLLRATLESTADGILVVDHDGKIVDYNGKFVDMWRIPETILETRDDQTALSQALDQVKDPDTFIAKVRQLYETPEASSSDVFEFKDGRIFERYSQPQIMSGKTVGRVWSFRDLTQQSRLESNLRQSQKMDAIGQLAGGIAHDFNNLLSVIQNYAVFLSESLEEGDARKEDVAEIRRASSRAASLTRQLLTFSRKEVVQPVVVDPGAAVAEVADMLGRTLREDIELSLGTAPGVRKVEIDAGQMHQLLMNLAINASDAMPDGGTLTVGTRNVDLHEPLQVVTGTLLPGEYVGIEVADTGCGMDKKVLERVFEPFFTTKPRGTGTGLGLPTVYGIVERAGGHISVESKPGSGTRVTVYLPALPEGTEDDVSPKRVLTSAGMGEKILIVEDEGSVRNVVSRILSENGYSVVAASSGSEALDLFAEQADIDVVLTDVIMPGISGKQLADRIRELRPELPILYMSGYEDRTISKRGVLEEKSYIQKPFTASELLFKIAQVMESPLTLR